MSNLTPEKRAAHVAPCSCVWRNYPRNVSQGVFARDHEDWCPGLLQAKIAAAISEAESRAREECAAIVKRTTDLVVGFRERDLAQRNMGLGIESAIRNSSRVLT